MYSIFTRFSSVIFTLFQIFLFTSAINLNSRFLSIIILSYFYYSAFTGWHECVHRDFSRKNISFEKLIGVINMVPLLFLNYRSKLSNHIKHHTYTNDERMDPDYSINNFLFSKSFIKLNIENHTFKSLDFIEVLLKIFFIFIIYKFWFLNSLILDFLISYFVGNIIVHLIVNLLPHFRTCIKNGRDFKSTKLINLFLLGNNLHGTHHRMPTKPWWALI